MRTKILLLILLLGSPLAKLFCQSGTFSFDKMNVAFKGVENHLTITIPKSIILKETPTLESAKGKFKFIDSTSTKFNAIFKFNGKFEETGKHEIIIKSDVDTIFSYKIRCKEIPNPVFKLDLKYESGEISKNVFKSAIGIGPVLVNFDFYYIFKTKSYKCSIIKKGKLFKEFDCNQVKFSDKMKVIFQKLDSGDIVIFEKIKVIEESGKIRTIPSVNYRLK